MRTNRRPLPRQAERVDASALLAWAARIDEQATILRARAARIGAQAAATHWYSPASRRYFAQLDDATATLLWCATRMSGVADLARRLAASAP
jgi:hypothetical protein